MLAHDEWSPIDTMWVSIDTGLWFMPIRLVPAQSHAT